MVLWSCYHDTSGDENDKNVLVTAGVVANAKKWARFERSWGIVLKVFGVTQFHMKDFAHFKHDYATGWEGDEGKRKHFIRCLVGVMKRHLNKEFITGILLDDYREVNRKYRCREEFGGPYSIAQAGSIDRATMWLARKKHPLDRVEHFIESGDVGQNDFMKLAKQVAFEPTRLPKVDPNTGLHRLPFQAADLVAYEYRDLYDQYRGTGKIGRLRGSLLEIRRMLPLDAAVADRAQLTKLCRDAKVPERD